MTIPRFLEDLLDAPPRTGEGVHLWLFRVSRQLHAHLPAIEIVALLEGKTRNCGRHVPRHEIISAVQNSLGCAWRPNGANYVQPVRKWPPVNQEQREAITRDVGIADLWELSPIRLGDNEQHTEEIIDHLFPGDPLLCCGRTNSEFDTKPRSQWRGELNQLALIVPSPMSALTGITKEGKESAHCLNNTGARRFLVCEFDTGTADNHAALLIHLASHAPMVCAVHSGNKSLHGWFYCEGQSDERVMKFFRYAASLGADPATWTRSQFVRMPDGTRDNGKPQTVFFLNFAPLEVR